MSIGHIIVIGSMKCGTTSLHFILRQHEEIAGSNPKELNVFTRGVDPNAYVGHFPICSGLTRYTLESSPAYTKANVFKDDVDYSIPKRIEELPNQARLIYIMRDPIERINSHIGHNIGHGRVTEAKFGLKHPISVSSYASQLDIFSQIIGRERILLMSLSDLKARPREALEWIGAFLDVDTSGLNAGQPRKVGKHGTDFLNKDQRALVSSRLIGEMERLVADYSFDEAAIWAERMRSELDVGA